MSTDYQKRVADLRELAAAQGWTVAETKKGHLSWYVPNGKGIVVSATSASDWRAFRNTVSALRREGLNFRGDEKAVPTLKDSELVRFPHITAIISQWQHPEWADKDEQAMLEIELFAAVENSERLAWIKHEMSIYWGDREGLIQILKDNDFHCTCGQEYLEAIGLGSHVVKEHERNRTHHAPVGIPAAPYGTFTAEAAYIDQILELEAENGDLRTQNQSLTDQLRNAQQRAEHGDQLFEEISRIIRQNS